jgi:hypothetical protein
MLGGRELVRIGRLAGFGKWQMPALLPRAAMPILPVIEADSDGLATVADASN